MGWEVLCMSVVCCKVIVYDVGAIFDVNTRLNGISSLLLMLYISSYAFEVY